MENIADINKSKINLFIYNKTYGYITVNQNKSNIYIFLIKKTKTNSILKLILDIKFV
jgi:hypothetical protein